MARLPDLIQFAAEHKLKIGTIADLIELSQPQRVAGAARRASARSRRRGASFAWSPYRDLPVGALPPRAGAAARSMPRQETLVRVHEPLSVIDLLDAGTGTHSWGVGEALQRSREPGSGVMVLMNCSQSGDALEARLGDGAPSAPERRRAAWTCASTASARRSCATSASAACA